MLLVVARDHNPTSLLPLKSTMKSLSNLVSVAILVVLSFLCAGTVDGFSIAGIPTRATATTRSSDDGAMRQPTTIGAWTDEESSSVSCSQNPKKLSILPPWVSSIALASTLLFGGASIMTPLPAHADGGATVVGKLQGSGLVFKDTLQIERFEDPKVKGVELYISNFDRPITEKLSGNLFNDPAYASVACAKVGKVAIADNIAKGLGGEEVFEESRSLLFKTLRVQRIYDTDTNTVVYVSYNTRFDKSDDSNKSRFKSSLCAVNLND